MRGLCIPDVKFNYRILQEPVDPLRSHVALNKLFYFPEISIVDLVNVTVCLALKPFWLLHALTPAQYLGERMAF